MIGLVGGVASGKSFVAAELVRRGAVAVDADRAGHEVLRQPEVIEDVRRCWGESVLDADGQVDRRALARIVFAPPPDGPLELARLERLTHPLIRARLADEIAQVRRQGQAAAIVLDAPVMLKAGWDRFCDHLLMVECDQAVRRSRAAARGWTAEEFARREAAQESLDRKRGAADLVMDNSGTPPQTSLEIDRLWPLLTAPRPAGSSRP